MATIGGIEGKGRVTLTTVRGLKQYIGSITVAPEKWRRAAELLSADEPVRYVGSVRSEQGTKSVTLNVRVTKVHTPTIGGARVDFVSTGPPVAASADDE
jgi:hypothetical protein